MLFILIFCVYVHTYPVNSNRYGQYGNGNQYLNPNQSPYPNQNQNFYPTRLQNQYWNQNQYRNQYQNQYQNQNQFQNWNNQNVRSNHFQPYRPPPVRMNPCNPSICEYQYHQCYSYCQQISYSPPKPWEQRSEPTSVIEVLKL